MGTSSNVYFSVITVCYNAEKTICETIESVLMQDYKNFEYIIVDGASTDSTVDLVRQYAEADNRIEWHSEPDSGIFNAMNKGIRYANGNVLFFLNAGDVLHSEDVLGKVAEVAAQSDIVIGDIAFKAEHGLRVKKYAVGSELRENLERGKMVCHQVIFATPDCLKQGFDERFKFCADYDWLCSQVNAGKKIAKVDAIIVDYDLHGVTNQVKHHKVHFEEYFAVIGKYFPQPGFKQGAEVKRLFIQGKKENILYQYMNRWLFLKQRGISLGSFFVSRGIQTIAIYGFHFMGQRLFDELKDSRVEVAYAIDRNPAMEDYNIPILSPDDTLKHVDAVVITPMWDFLEIKDNLSTKLDCPMISIEDVLSFEYEK